MLQLLKQDANSLNDAIASLNEYTNIIQNSNSTLYMCIKLLLNKPDDVTVFELKSIKQKALLEVKAEQQFCKSLVSIEPTKQNKTAMRCINYTAKILSEI